MGHYGDCMGHYGDSHISHFMADNGVCQRTPEIELYSINSFPI